jgi:hypothetical protein
MLCAIITLRSLAIWRKIMAYEKIRAQLFIPDTLLYNEEMQVSINRTKAGKHGVT